MSFDKNTFGYLKPTSDQQKDMDSLRYDAALYAQAIAMMVPEGPDKTYALRKLREVAMWVNVAVTRHPDGSQRT